MITSANRPFRPVDLKEKALEVLDLESLAEGLLGEAQYETEGKAGVTLTRDRGLSVVLEVLRKGGELGEHRAPGPAMVTLFSGRARFVSSGRGEEFEVVPGRMVLFAPGLEHALVAEEDCVCLIVIGGRAHAE